MAEELQTFLATLVPDWEKQLNSEQPGNFLASQMKKIHEDSNDVTSKSVYNNELFTKKNRWKSLYKSDYLKLLGDKDQPPKELESNPEHMRMSGVMVIPSTPLHIHTPEKTFMRWKVPSRLTDGPPSRGVTPRELGSVSARENSPTRGLTPKFPNIRHSQPPETANSYERQLKSPRKSSGSPRKSAREVGSPDIPGRGRTSGRSTAAKERSFSAPMASLPQVAAKDPTLRVWGEPKTCAVQRVLNPDPETKVEEWWDKAPSPQRHQVEQALRLAAYSDNKNDDNSTMAVYDWLKTAKPRDRAVAMSFFQSLSGSKLQGDDSDQQRDKAKEILQLLSKNQDIEQVASMPYGQYGDAITDRQLKYLRLLTPSTRKNRWMHTTWHHLPHGYGKDPTENKSAVYLNSQAPMFRHYTIHPEWG